MLYRQLGKSNLEISEISMGCMSLQTSNPNATAVIAKALDYGINFLDTADLYEYGQNEVMLGQAIRDRRQDLIIATKVGNEWTPARDGWTWNPTKKYILKAVEGSLKRLQTDYIDLYQLHGGTIDDPIDETIEAFELLKDQGKIREYGISSIRPNVIREYVKRSNIVSVMMQYSLLDRRPEETCLPLLAEANVSVITRGTLAKGLLVDKPAGEYLGHSIASVSRAREIVQEISDQSNLDPSTVATGYVLAKKSVASAVIGFRTTAQVTSLLDNLTDLNLKKEDKDFLTQAIKAIKYANHR